MFHIKQIERLYKVNTQFTCIVSCRSTLKVIYTCLKIKQAFLDLIIVFRCFISEFKICKCVPTYEQCMVQLLFG